MRLALVTNEKSGTRTDGDRVAAALRACGATVESLSLDAVGEAAASRVERLVVAGGDGSLGPAARAASDAGIAFAVVPTGTANDFARALGLPTELPAAAALAADPAARTRRVELACVGDRPFLNAASAGLSVVAAQAARPHKARLGALAYALGGVRAGLTARPLPCRVACDGHERFAGSAWQVIVAATGAFGGGSEVGGTDPRDHRLDVAVLPAGPRPTLVLRAVGMRTGRLAAQRGVLHARAREVEVDVPPGTRFNVDGEVCTCEPARFALHDRPVEVVTGR